ncbi:hypothetical protein ES703_103390 [subsurface metagenome]
MAEKKLPRVVGAPIWGIILVFLGVVFLLQTLNVLPWGLWGSLWRFWPVLIIITGLAILLRRYNVWLVSLIVLVILGACLGIAVWQYGPSSSAGVTTRSFSQPLGSLEGAQIEVDFTVGSITISSLPSGSSNFVEVNSEVKSRHESMKVSFHQEDGEGRLCLSTVNQQFWGEDGFRWEVSLTRNIPLAIDVRSAVSSVNLDLGELGVTELRLDIDAGNCQVRMPSSAGITYAYIEVNIANLEIIIPDGVAAKVWVDADLTALDVDISRFLKNGDYYLSRDFDMAENRVELEIDCNVSRVQIR